ncbi:hypothetical protein [Halosimplex sp. J119]
MGSESSDGVTWYLAGEASVNGSGDQAYIGLPSILIDPDESDRTVAGSLPDDLTPPFRESDEIDWHYQTDSGLIVMSYPQLEESKANPRGPKTEEKRYQHVGQGSYGPKPMNESGSISSWKLTVPKKFFPEKYEGPAKASRPVEDKAALNEDTSGWVVFHDEMVVDSPYSCYFLRRNGEINQFITSVVRPEDDIVVLVDGFQDMTNESIESLFDDEPERGGPRFL